MSLFYVGQKWYIRLAPIGLLLLFFCVLMSPLSVRADKVNPTQAELEQQLQDIEKEIADYQKQLDSTTTKKKTLTNAINQLRIKQQQLNALLKETTLRITSLNQTITVSQRDLDAALSKENLLKGQIADAIWSIHVQEIRPLFILASAQNLSSAFTDVQHFGKISGDLGVLIDQVKKVKSDIQVKKEALEGQKENAQELLKIKTAQNQSLLGTIGEQNSLLTQTKGLEANYQATIADKQKRAAEIRNRIYELFNTGTQVTFGQAVEIAKMASRATGVRAAFLLAILTQESNLGKNVGTCNRAGDPPEKSWKVVMKPTRDQEPFLVITKELGLDPDTTPVSCPMRNKDGSQLGWGGAMGPAQFIPSTWMGYKDKIKAITGKTANPWDIRDAFLAAGIKLGSQGAKSKDGEWKAAMLYFSGSTNLAYRFYGDNVVATANKYQDDIDALNE